MCFNVFAPLSTRLELAREVLRPFVPGLAAVKAIAIEHTPPADIFNDQSGLGGVDCDLFIEGTNARGEGLVLVIETKFVEPEFSVWAPCGRRARTLGMPLRGQQMAALGEPGSRMKRPSVEAPRTFASPSARRRTTPRSSMPQTPPRPAGAQASRWESSSKSPRNWSPRPSSRVQSAVVHVFPEAPADLRRSSDCARMNSRRFSLSTFIP